MVKLKDIVEDLELGKVYTDKDRPPFQVKEETITEGPDSELFKKLSKHQAEIFKLLNNYKSKANVPAIARSFMIGLKNQLKKDKMVESINENDLQRATRIYNDFEDIIGKFGKDVVRITKDIEKLKGDKTDSKIFIKQYVKGINPLLAMIRSWFKGEQRRPR